jgi:hypothetical protein
MSLTVPPSRCRAPRGVLDNRRAAPLGYAEIYLDSGERSYAVHVIG